ncbi:hypothetical protein D770_14650 [Flammeovirgaceae bacterium 311]|nr:hypothetical protein D770_14650 [Flammeovirgaceae bacterium 311]
MFKAFSEMDIGDREFMLNSLSPTVGIKTARTKDEKLPVGSSKIGGQPDLPPNIDWPRFNNEPLSFCAQYNCLEFNRYDKNYLLPSEGMLYVFVYVDKSWPGFLNTDGSYKIIYTGNHNEIFRRPFPQSYFKESIFETAKIDYFQFYTLPDDENYKLIELRKKYLHFSNYYDNATDIIYNVTGQAADNYHQLLGEDRSVQSSVVWEFAAKALNIRTSEDYETKKHLIDELKKDYIMLLQLDSGDKNTSLAKFGGSSVMYFGIKPEDLKQKRFDQTILAFQGT